MSKSLRPLILLAVALLVACGSDDKKQNNGGAGGTFSQAGTNGQAGTSSGASGASGASGNGVSGASGASGASGSGGASGTAAGGSGGASGTNAADGAVNPDGSISEPGDAGLDAAAADGGETNDAGDAAVSGTDASVESDGGVWPPPPATGDLQGLPQKWATAVCKSISQCVVAPLYEVAYDGMACTARVQSELEDGDYVYLQASIDAGRIVLDPTALAACYSDLGMQSCAVISSRSPASCKSAIKGQVGAGGACVIDDDCAGAAFCDRSAACPGVCSALLAAATKCDRSDQCMSGLVCDNAKCQAPVAAAADCGGGVAAPCVLDALCVGADSTMNKAGKCIDQDAAFTLNANADCDPGAGKWCKTGLACVVDVQTRNGKDTVVQVCKARVTAGKACNFALAPEQCPEGQYCPADLNPAYQSTCVARPKNGAACGPFDVCAAGQYCNDKKKCEPIGRIGDACAHPTECVSDICTTKLCEAPTRCRLDPPVSCGDHSCNGSEDCSTCADDCGACPSCGDNSCNGTENCKTCPSDCGACPPSCGDGMCNGTETCSSCTGDCGPCAPVCGDHSCNGTETCSSCVGDCGACPITCGDNACNGTETCSTCAMDCGACPAPYSGPCDNDAACKTGKKCALSSDPFFGTFGYCAETCTMDSQCSGSTAQRKCTGGVCTLQCNPLAILDPTRTCPTGMTCIANVCTRKR